MVDNAAFLHTAVVAAADDFAVEHENGTDGNPAFGASLPRLLDGSLHERVWGVHKKRNLRDATRGRQGSRLHRLDTRLAAGCHSAP